MEWIYFIHAPREDFAATMTPDERAVWDTHFERLQRLTREGVMILVGPTLGRINTGIAVFEAPDEEAARRIMEEDPAIASGIARGELRPFAVALLRGRDDVLTWRPQISLRSVRRLRVVVVDLYLGLAMSLAKGVSVLEPLGHSQ